MERYLDHGIINVEIKTRKWYLVQLIEADDPFSIGERGWMVGDAVECGVSWEQFVNLVKEWEQPISQGISLRDRIKKIRRLSHKKDLPFDSVIGAPLDSNDKYINDITENIEKWQLFKDVTKVHINGFKRANDLDIHHLLVGMDVLNENYNQSTTFTYMALSTVPFDFDIHNNYAACTWAGDLGSAAAEHHLKYKFDRIEERYKNKYEETKYFDFF